MADSNLKQLDAELTRLGAEDVLLAMDEDFEPDAGPLVKVEIEDAYWHLPPSDLLQLLRELPDKAGSDAIKQTIEQNAQAVWHGPAPEDSRDTPL
jgi:hypothetical protein